MNTFVTSIAGVAALSGLLAMAPPNHTSGSDTTFATKFAASGDAEIALAKIALAKSKNPAVVAFAKKMIADHTMAGDKLMKIATAKGLSIATQPLPSVSAMEQKLQNAPADQFDSLYRTDNAMGHQMALALLNTEIGSGKDATLVSYAKMTKPTVEQHRMLVSKLPTT